MPGYSDNGKHIMLDHLAGEITDISLHSDDPGSTGANEITGGDPAYARVSVTGADWDAAAAGAVELNNDKEFDGPADQSVSHFGIWAGTDFLGGGGLTGDLAFNAEGDYVLQAGTSFDLNAA